MKYTVATHSMKEFQCYDKCYDYLCFKIDGSIALSLRFNVLYSEENSTAGSIMWLFNLLLKTDALSHA